MKALVLSLGLISFSAFAGLVGDFPKVAFGNTFVSVDSVCVNGANVQTINEVTVCTERDHGKNGYCKVEENKILSTPINYKMEIPVGRHKFEMIDASIPLNYQIPFGYPSKNGIRVVKVENFSLPLCE